MDTSCKEHYRMDRAKPVVAGNELLKVVENKRHRKSQRKRCQQSRILSIGTKHTSSTNTAKQNCRREVGVDSRAGETVLLIPWETFSQLRHGKVRQGYLRFAEILNVLNLEIHDSSGHEGGHNYSNDLRTECLPLGNLDVVGELEVVCEVECMSRRHIADPGSVSFSDGAGI